MKWVGICEIYLVIAKDYVIDLWKMIASKQENRQKQRK